MLIKNYNQTNYLHLPAILFNFILILRISDLFFRNFTLLCAKTLFQRCASLLQLLLIFFTIKFFHTIVKHIVNHVIILLFHFLDLSKRLVLCQFCKQLFGSLLTVLIGAFFYGSLQKILQMSDISIAYIFCDPLHLRFLIRYRIPILIRIHVIR